MSGAISGDLFASRYTDPDVAPLIRATVLNLRRDQILHLHAVAVLDDLGDPLPVAMGMVALIAEDAHRTRLVHQRRQLVEFLLRLRRLQMRRIDLVQQTELAAARRLPAALRRPEAFQMQVGNAALIEAGEDVRFLARRIVIRGSLGEIVDDTVTRLTPEGPMTSPIVRARSG